MTIEGNRQEHPLFFFSGGETYVIIGVWKSHQLYPINPNDYHVLQFHHLLIYWRAHIYMCAMEMPSYHIKLFVYAIFCKNCKNHPL